LSPHSAPLRGWVGGLKINSVEKIIDKEKLGLMEEAYNLMERRSNFAFIGEQIRLTKEPVSPPSEYSHLIEVKLAKEGGVFSYYEGKPYPRKGFPMAETVEKIDNIKKVIWTVLSVFLRSKIIVAISFIFFRKNLFNSYWELLKQADRSLTYHILAPHWYSKSVREVYRALSAIKEEPILIQLVCMFLEFDDSYRYRFQDIVGELNKENLLKNPFKEITRLVALLKDREGTPEGDQRMKKMWGDFEILLFILFFSRTVRGKIIGFFSELNPENIKMDDGDMYYVNLKKGGYNWGRNGVIK